MAAVGDFRFPLEASLTLGAWHEPSSAHQIEGDTSARLSAPSSTSLLRQRKAATTATTAAKREERKEENMKEEDEQKVEKKAKEEEGVYTLEEVGQHKGPTSYWIAVADSVYDVSAFVLSGRHPGGDLILQGMGRDATVMFKTSHPARVQALLSKYYIGKLKRPDGFFNYSWDSKFYDVLQERVYSYFTDNNIPKQGSPVLWLQAFQTVFFFFLFMYFGYIQGNLLACAMMGWFYSQFGIMIMHDGTHGGFSKNPTISKLASLVMDLMGSSSLVWQHEHNIGHHQYTNTSQDPDATTAFPMLRYHPSQPWRSYHRYQHYYVWLLYPFIVYKWYLSDIVFVIKKQYRDIPMYTPPTSYLIIFAVTKAVLPLWVILLPCYLHGTAYGLLCMTITFCVASYAFALQFVITHLADDVIFPEEVNQENDWAKCQVLGSSNYSTSNPIAAWLSGGLNFQIEHHLFPTISHTRLSEIAPIVKRTCEEFGVPYFEHPNFWVALQHHYQHLRRMSIRPHNTPKVVPVSAVKSAKYDIMVFSGCMAFLAAVGLVCMS